MAAVVLTLLNREDQILSLATFEANLWKFKGYDGFEPVSHCLEHKLKVTEGKRILNTWKLKDAFEKQEDCTGCYIPRQVPKRTRKKQKAQTPP